MSQTDFEFPEPDGMIVRRHEDGSLSADPWPEYMLFAEDVLEDGFAPNHVYWVRPGILRISLTNGEADYAVGEPVAPSADRPARRIRLVER